MADFPDEVRYQRVCAAVATLGELATGPCGARLAGVLAGDEVVLARMRAAAAVMRTVSLPAGLAGLDPGDWAAGGLEASDLVAAASRWQRYAQSAHSSVPDLHRSCATDIARGLLRLWDRRRQPLLAGALARRVQLRQSRITLLSLVRTRCAALRSELRGDVAAMNLRRVGAFPQHVDRRVAAVAAELTDAVDWELPGAGAAVPFGVDAPLPYAADGRLDAVFAGAFGLGMALTLGRVLAGLAPGGTATVVAVSAVAGLALAGWVMAARRLLARRAALDRWVSDVVIGLRARLDDHIAMRALAAEARLAAAAAGGVRRCGDEPGDRSDILAITDRLHTDANVQVRDGSCPR